MRVRAWLFLGAAALSTSCALVYGYGDYQDATSGTTSSGAGGGAACSLPTDCPSAVGPCADRTCTGGRCGVAYQPLGTPGGAQTTGDCKKGACDGAGSVVSQNDDKDAPPDDGNDCTNDVCSGGTPTHPPSTAGTPCGVGKLLKCNGNGQCQGCTMPAQCGSDGGCFTWVCAANSCSQMPKAEGKPCGAASCAGGMQEAPPMCAGGTCAPGAKQACDPYACGPSSCLTSCADKSECAAPNICTSSVCGPPKMGGAPCGTGGECASTFCEDGVCCDVLCSTLGACSKCTAVAKQSGPDGICGPAKVGAACGPPPACADSQHIAAQSACNMAGNCAPGATIDCTPSTCDAGTCGNSCSMDSECAQNAHCLGTCCASCFLYAQGTATYDELCTSGKPSQGAAMNLKACGCQVGNCPGLCATICSSNGALMTLGCAVCLGNICGSQLTICKNDL